MFSAKIIESAKFIKMPTSSQLLYFHLGMKADDDGIAEAFNVMRMIGASEDDLKILVAKNYVVVLNEDLVSFITDWNEHNLIRADRKVDSVYKNLLLQIIPEVQLLESKERKDTLLRSKMHKESDLPDKFNGIMRAMFFGEKCPVCGEKMTEGKSKPSIQHNNPISKGGKHNIDNISVICLSCNMTIKDNETNSLNNELVKQNWELYLKSKSVDSEWTESGQDAVSIGKVRLGEDRIEEVNKENSVAKPTRSRFTPPTLEEVKDYCLERNNGVDPVKWFNFYEAKGWMVGKNKMTKWKAAIHTWEKNDNNNQARKVVTDF